MIRFKKSAHATVQVAPDPLGHVDPVFAATPRANAAGPVPQQAPPAANDDSYTTSDSAVLTGNLFDNDTPGDVPFQVTHVNGSALAVDREIILASGARLRVNADGGFTYNPNGAFDSVPTTDDAFTYTIAGGDGATVTVTVFDPSVTHLGTDNPETLNGTPGDDVMEARGGNDIVNGFGGNDSIDGGTGDDVLVGGAGNDTYFVDSASDTVTELDGEGYDIVIASVNYTLGAAVYVEELVAAADRIFGIQLIGNELDNIIRGASGNDNLQGGAGNDLLDRGTLTEGGLNFMTGGTGDDTYLAGGFGGFTDPIFENDGEGYDIVYVVRVDLFELSGNAFVELIAPLATLNLPFVTIVGSNSVNEIRGTEGNDQLNGRGGADTLIGYGGNDIYTIDQLGDVIVEAADGGIDTIRTPIDFTLSEGGNVENLRGGLNANGTISDNPASLGGNSFANEITGGNGGDIILGGAGNDILLGAGGNDSLYGEEGNDRLEGGEGSDLMFGDGGDDMLLGQNGNDFMIGGAGADTMNGGAGDDTYYVHDADDVVVESSSTGGRDVVYTPVSYELSAGARVEVLSTDSLGATSAINLVGNAFAQEIYGNAGANFLAGGGGGDQLFGLGGDDAYLITDGSEQIVETAGNGRDVVYAQLSYTLGAGVHVEILSSSSLTGTQAINLTGNALVQEIYGNAGANLLNGGGGADTLVGLGGDDAYLITDGSEQIFETAGNGRDVAYTSVSHVLGAGVHVEIFSTTSLAGTAALNLTGNELAQEIYGNAGANTLNGGGGADLLIGVGGDDVYFITGGSEQIIETAGNGRDVVYASVSHALGAGVHVEVLSTASLGGTAPIDLAGNELAQEIYGNAGLNSLNGGGGADYLAGLGGADTFAFTTALGGGNVDVVADLISGTDRIALDDAVFTGLAPGALPPGAFVIGSAAGDADDRIVYNSATGQLYFDADGSGAAAQVLFATLNAGQALAAGDFTVI